MKAFCWQTGLIQFGQTVPEGAILISEAPAKRLRAVINATARHARRSEQLLVPGVLEAPNGRAKVDALIAYCKWIAPRLKTKAGKAVTA